MRQQGRPEENVERNSDIEKQLGHGVDSRGYWRNLDPTKGFILMWHEMFLVACVLTVSIVDPLFLYLPVINEDDKCLALDRKLKITAICLRLMFDLIYFANIILEFLCPYIDEEARSILGLIVIIRDAKKIRKRYLRSYFVIDVLSILPIPQVLVPIIISKRRSSKFLDTRKLLNAIVILQYVPRFLRIHQSWEQLIKTSRKVDRTTWIRAFHMFVHIILASLVLGAFWYFFSIERETACWHVACANRSGCTLSSFKCGHNFGNYTFLNDACPVQTPNTTLINFGIFLEALQSGTVSSTNILQKIMHCSWWGLRNLRSLGLSLQTSNYFWENFFAVSISVIGLLQYWQTYVVVANDDLKYKMRLNERQIRLWTSKNKLSYDIEVEIISIMHHRLEKNRSFDVEKPLLHLPSDLTKKIKHHLCLPILRKVEILQNRGEYFLRLICEYLKPLYYNEDSYIIREGEPLNAMLFIKQGRAWCFKTSNGESGERPQCIEEDQFYGQELLEWGFNTTHELSNIPISIKTVKTRTKVEAFALTANDLNILVSRHFQALPNAETKILQAVRRGQLKKSRMKIDSESH